MLKISFAGCLGLSPVISTQFTLEMCVAATNREKITKTAILGFKVVQGYRCWYLRKVRQQCLLWCAASLSICNRSLARLDDSSRNREFLYGLPKFDALYGGLLELRGSNLTPLKSTFKCRIFHTQVVMVYLEWFRRNSVLKCVLQPKIAKNSLKPLFWGFKVVQGHRCRYHWKARRQCLLW